MVIRSAWTAQRPWRQVATVAVTLGAVGLVGTVPAVAAPHHRHPDDQNVVDCRERPSALRTAIASATAGDKLLVKGTCIGPFTIDKNLTLSGVRHAVLDGNYAGSTVTVTAGSRVRLSNLTITHGSASASGGGILNSGALTLTHSTVRHNAAAVTGGGIDNVGLGASMTLSESTVEDNTANNAGGIGNGLGSTMILARSTVRENAADNGGGVGNSGILTISESAVRHNRATNRGGGISNIGTVTLIRTTVERNTAGDGPGSGGGIFSQFGTVLSTDSRVRNNDPDNCAPAGSVPGCIG